MGHGKYQAKWRFLTFRWVMIGVALAAMTVGGVAAYLSVSGGSLENTFTAETAVQPNVLETFSENNSLVKENVCVDVGNPGYAVYVRAAVVVTWRDAAGNVLAQSPVENKDYTISMGDDWFRKGDFWYCRTMVNSGTSPVLIKDCTVTASKGDYHLHVEIVAQTIQALGTTDVETDAYPNGKPAVTEAWGVEVSTADGTKGQLIS